MFNKTSKKSPKLPQGHISLGIIPSNIAVGPLGYRAELAATTGSEQNRPHRDLEADDPDSIVALDEKDTRTLRVVSQENKNGDQGLTITPLKAVLGTISTIYEKHEVR